MACRGGFVEHSVTRPVIDPEQEPEPEPEIDTQEQPVERIMELVRQFELSHHINRNGLCGF